MWCCCCRNDNGETVESSLKGSLCRPALRGKKQRRSDTPQRNAQYHLALVSTCDFGADVNVMDYAALRSAPKTD